MSEPARNRFALDLDDLERQLRGAAEPVKAGAAVDPLIELTRIVGQDDPLKGLFGPRGVPAQANLAPAQLAPVPRQEPNFEREPAFAEVPLARSEAASPPAEMRGALDEFEALLRRTDGPRPQAQLAAEPPFEARVYGGAVAGSGPRDLDEAREHAYGQGHAGQPQGDYPEPPLLADDEMPDLEPQRSRKGLWTAAVLIGVGIIGVAGAMAFRGKTTGSNGLPPVISADSGPTKVAPANPGGAEIPNQNKQIYERAGETPADKTKTVSREEQPVDVQQAARALPPRVVLPGSASSNTTAQQPAGNTLAQAPATPERAVTPAGPALTPIPPVPGLGEPRRVRTVSIRPDGTPAPTSAPAAGGLLPSADPANSASPTATGSAPARIAANPTAPAAIPVPRPRSAVTPEPPKAQERIAAPATTPSSPSRLASAAPAPSAAPAVAAIRSGTGDFAVQLGAPGSESEARATFSALQRKYPAQLGGQAPIVRKTDLAGGKTVYRLRVGPYSREDATTMCTQLQAAGGQCFIAKN